MELLTLTLRAPIPYVDGATDPLSLEAAANSLGEGGELLFVFDGSASVQDTPDGPRWNPRANPERFGRMAKPGEEATFELPAGSYRFAQYRAPHSGAGDLAEACEWFVRESWWTQSGGSGPLFARLVAEDGKIAIQVLRAT